MHNSITVYLFVFTFRVMTSSAVLLLLFLTVGTAVFAHARGRVIHLDEVRGIDGFGICWDDGYRGIPCGTLNYALEGLHRRNATQLIIQPGHYYLKYDPTVMAFQWMQNISIVGNVSDSAGSTGVSITCKDDAGLSFVRSSAISLANITFFNCGAVHNSTSRNYNTDHSYLKFRAGLYFLFCKGVHFSQVTVARSNGIGLVLYSTVGENTFQDCTFSHNSVSGSDEYTSGGGGVYLEFCYCEPGDLNCSKGGSRIPLEYASNAVYAFDRCTFKNNNGSLGENLADLAHAAPGEDHHVAFGRGGGLSIFVKGNARHNRILVKQSQFRGNTAVWGAGLFVELQDSAENNTITIAESSLMNNQCPMDYHGNGGGARLGYVYYNDTYASHNRIIVDTCLIYHNSAYAGGGVSFYAPREPNSMYSTNRMDFIQCSWWNNEAKFGTALHLGLWQLETSGSVVRPTLRSCTFQRNRLSMYTTTLDSTVGIGTVLVDSLSISIQENITFQGNDGSALAVATGSVEFLKNCFATFKNNSGRNGGGIVLLGSYIRVHSGTHLVFKYNKADYNGGAIFSRSVFEENVFSSMTGCFIRYSNIMLSPSKWNSTFYFKGNTAGGVTNSIYTSSLATCLFEDSLRKHTLEEVFCWNDSYWVYAGSDCSEQIRTAPAKFMEKDSAYGISIFPGESHKISFKLSDDRNNRIPNPQLFAVKPLNQSVTTSNNYITDKLSLHGPPNVTASISVETSDPRVLRTTLTVTFLPCPPGYIYDNSSMKCNCTGEDDLVFGGRVICNGPGLAMAWIKQGTWLGMYGKNDRLVAGKHSYIAGPMFTNLITLPNTSSELDNFFCRPMNRTGTLCSDCIDDFAPAFNSPSFKCTKCTPLSSRHNWVWYILIRFLPLIVFFIVVVAFHVNLTSGPANSFVLFAQVIVTSVNFGDGSSLSFSNISSAQRVFRDIYLVIYDLANLDFLQGVLKPICLAPNIDTLHLVVLEYVIAGFPLFLMLVFYLLLELYERGVAPVICVCRPFHACFAYFKRKWNIQRSVIDGFATFIILSYSKFTILSFYLLAPTALIGISGENVDMVLYYNGNIRYLSKQHLPYFITALALTMLFVMIPPLLLLVYPLKAMKKCAKYCKPNRYLHGIKTRFNHFLDAFQGCYRDGTNGSRDCRYFAGLYFLFRILLVLVYYLTAPDWILLFLIKQFLFSIAVLLFAIIRPYSEEFYNNLDTTIFTILALLNAFTLYSSYRAQESTGASVHWYYVAFQYFLIYLPIVYIACFLTHRFWKSYKCKIKRYLRKRPCCKSRSLRLVDSEEALDDSDELTKRMHVPNTYRPSRQPSIISEQEKNERSIYQ